MVSILTEKLEMLIIIKIRKVLPHLKKIGQEL